MSCPQATTAINSRANSSTGLYVVCERSPIAQNAPWSAGRDGRIAGGAVWCPCGARVVPVWCGVVWCGVVWCVVWYGMEWCGVVWYGTVWYGMVWYGMVWYGMVWYGMVWYGMAWYGMV